MSWLDRDLIATQIINLTTQVTGVLPTANGGTGLSSVGANGTVLTVVAGAPAWAAPASAGYSLVATVSDSNHTLNEFSTGIIVVPFSSLSASRVLTLPDAIQSGTVVLAGTTDNTITDTNTIVWTPASGTIVRINVSAATFTMKSDDFPLNQPAIFYKKASSPSLWVALN